jgi:hypothetical protein
MCEGSLLSTWNKHHPDLQVEVGMTIVSANGRSGYWDVLDEIDQRGHLELRIRPLLPEQEEGWRGQIDSLSEALRERHSTDQGSLRLRFRGQDHPGESPEEIAAAFTYLPSVRAGECSATQCSICLEEWEPEDSLVRLPCQHVFHPVCAARWLTQTSSHTCPLCKQPVCRVDDAGSARTIA